MLLYYGSFSYSIAMHTFVVYTTPLGLYHNHTVYEWGHSDVSAWNN